MWVAIILGFLAGTFGANGVPHFVKGVTKDSYPCVLGNSPVPNRIGGWGSFVVAGLSAAGARAGQHPGWAFAAAALGVLGMGLFHARGAAFGRSANPPAGRADCADP